jgi:hypothetical protein
MSSKRQTRRKAARSGLARPSQALLATDAAIAPAPTVAPIRVVGAIWSRLAAIVSHRAFPVVALVGVYCATAATYAALSRVVVPNLFPDEMFYAKLSQNLAWGDGLTWRGSTWGLPPLWPALLSLSWHTGSVPGGYDIARIISAATIATAVLPVWLLARTLVGPRLALVPAALCVMGAWMQVTEFLASENLAYPLATAALACTVMSVRDTRTRWMVASIGFGLVAALTRTQMLVLPVILVLALTLDVVRQPRGEWRARIAARPRMLWIGLVVAVVGVLVAFVVKPNLTNYDVLGNHASIGAIASTTGRHAASTIVMFGFIPVATLLALMARKRNWRSDDVGPILITLVATVLVLLPVAGRFEVWATGGSPVERYTMYLAPLVFVALVLAPGRIGRRTGIAMAVVVGVALFASPLTFNYLEQPAVFGTQTRLYALAPFFRHHASLGIVLVAFPLMLVGVYALTARRRPALGITFAFGLVGAVLVTQAWTSQSLERSTIRVNRYDAVPRQLDWVDKHAHGDVAMIAVAKPQPWRPNIDLYTELFNRKIKYMYSTLPVGNGACNVDLKADGQIKQGTDYCNGFPREWVILDGSYKMALHGQKVLARTPHNGTLVRIPPGPPRVLGIVAPPCTANGCIGQLQLGMYLDAPTRVSVTFGATPTAHRVQTGNVVRELPAGRETTLNFKVPKGTQAVNLPVDWTNPQGAPTLKAVVLRSAAGTYRLY